MKYIDLAQDIDYLSDLSFYVIKYENRSSVLHFRERAFNISQSELESLMKELNSAIEPILNKKRIELINKLKEQVNNET